MPLPKSFAKEIMEKRPDLLETVQLIDEALSVMYPNPERIGCPPVEFLQEVAMQRAGIKKLPIETLVPWVDHFNNCSPCHNDIDRFARAIEEVNN